MNKNDKKENKTKSSNLSITKSNDELMTKITDIEKCVKKMFNAFFAFKCILIVGIILFAISFIVTHIGRATNIVEFTCTLNNQTYLYSASYNNQGTIKSWSNGTADDSIDDSVEYYLAGEDESYVDDYKNAIYEYFSIRGGSCTEKTLKINKNK